MSVLIKGKQVATPSELIETLTLESLKTDALFRGQSDSSFRLLPNFFRPEKIEQLIDQYPSHHLMEQWIRSFGFEQAIYDELPPYNSPILTPQKILLFKSLMPIFSLYRVIMVYNYHLHKYHEDNFGCLITDKKSLTSRDSTFWTKKENFIWFVKTTLPRLLSISSLDGKLIKDGIIDEDLTGIDETYPQHYDASTAALDWTYNFKIAIFFALNIWGHIDETSGLHLTSRQISNSNSLSIFVYEQIGGEKCPISIKPKTDLIYNERAEAQEGTFTYFSSPCSFYLKYGRFPSIDDYYHAIEIGKLPKTFILKKYDLPLTKSNQKWLLNYLNEHEINQKTLRLYNKNKFPVTSQI